MKKFIALLLISFFSINTFASTLLSKKETEWLQKHPTIILGSDSSWSPYIIENADGSISGYDADILNLVNKKTGANFQLKVGPWKDILKEAKEKKIDGLSTSAIHKEREEYFNFSKPYISTNRILIVSNTNPKQINSLMDLKNKKIAYQEQNLFDKKIVTRLKESTVIPMKSFDSILKALIKGEVDATVGSHAFIYFAQKRGLPYVKIVDELPNSTLKLVFSIRKDYKEALSILNKVLDSISEAEKTQLKNKWFFKNDSFGDNIQLTLKEKEYLKNNFPLKIQALKTFPPFSYVQNDKSKGYMIDYMQLMSHYLDTKIEFVNNKAWNETLNMLKKGEIDIIPQIAKNKERLKYIDFTNFAPTEYETGLAIRRNSKIKSFKDLEGKILSVVDKTFLHTYLKKNFPNQKLFITKSTKESLELLARAQVDAVIGNIPTFNYFIQRDWLSGIITVKIDDLGIKTKTPLYMGVSKGNATLRNILEKAQKAIPSSKVIKLKSKWMNIDKRPNEVELTSQERDYLRDKELITMCIDPNWMPLEKNENGKHIGMSADYINMMSKKLNTPIKMVPTKTWLESLELGKQKKCDIFSLVMPTPQRMEYLLFSEPYIHLPIVLATKITQPFINDISSITGKKIGTVKGYAYSELLKIKYPNMNFVEVKNEEEGLKQVTRGKLFGFIGTLTTVGYNIQNNHIGELKIAGKFNETWNLGVGIRNDEPQLQTIFNKAIKEIPAHKHQEILNKWVSVNYEEKIDYKRVIQISMVFILVILIFLYKNHSINKINQKLSQANEEIQEQQEMVDKYVLMIETDIEGKITRANEAFCKCLGFFENELIGNTYLTLQDSISDDKIKDMVTHVRADKPWSGEIINHTKQREIKNFFININSIYQNNTKIGYRAILEDITDKKKIEKLSITDKLTDIYNRLKLDELIEKQMDTNKRYELPFSIILIDVDDFKMVNDTYGHDVGDYVLKKLSKIFEKNTRVTDLVGRWGGEEFLIICPNTIAKNAHIVAEHIRFFIEQEYFDEVGSVTVSMGITEYKNSESSTNLFKRVDNALYEAKNNGKNQSVVL